jgi:hypothetical protein
VRVATDAEPLVAGKPQRPLMDDAIRATGADHPLAVGDRLDTDIAGANNVHIDSLLVLTGVSTPDDLLAAPDHLRPTYLAADLRGIEQDDLVIEPNEHWQAEADGTELSLRHTGSAADPLAALRALCAAWWSRGGGQVAVRPLDDAAADAVRSLGLRTT